MGRIVCGAALVVLGLLCLSGTARSDETGTCEMRTEPVTLAVEETLGKDTKAYLSLLANFGSEVTKEGVGPYPLATAGEDKFGCKPLPPVEGGKAVLLWRGGCSFLEKASHAQSAGAAAVIIVTDESELSPMSCVGNANVTIPVCQVLSEAGDTLATDADKGATIVLRELEMTHSIDIVASLSLLWLATLTIIIGALWSLHDKHLIFNPKARAEADGSDNMVHAIQEGLEINEMSALYFVIFASLVLLVIFFTMQHWIFVAIKCIFCFAAVQGLQALFFALFSAVYLVPRASQDVDLPVVGTVHVLSVPSVLAAVIVVAIWLINEGEPWCWILQDLMGMSFLVNVLRLVHLPNLKVATMLLVGAMCYDIFWVYIQPHLFGDESVMVKVAKGGEKHESLPMLFLMPKIGGTAGEYSMLGYGDVILPGLLVVHNHLFENRFGDRNIKYKYFMFSVVAYMAGLLLTFVALYFQVGGQGGQPALTYLVPTTVGTTVLVAWVSGDLNDMWLGMDHESMMVPDNEGDRLLTHSSQSV